MTASETLVLRFYADVWNERGDVADAAASELLADDYRDHNPAPGQSPGRAGIIDLIARCHGLVPDLRMLVDDLLVDGERVAVRWSAVGTCGGGETPCFRAAGIDIFRLRRGRIAEGWHAWDPASLRERLARHTDPMGEIL